MLEDTDIFQAVDVVYNAIYLNPLQQSHHWNTQITIKTVVHVQHVIAENIDLLRPSNFVQKGEMKLSDCLHKGLLVDIIRGVALDFININKDVHQYEEEDSNNDSSVLSSIEEEE